MSEIQNIYGSQRNPNSPPVQDDGSDEDFNLDSEVGDTSENFDSPDQHSQMAHITLGQIKDLERKVSSQKNLQGKDPDLLNILGEAEKEELEAEGDEKFNSPERKERAEKLHQEVDALYRKVSLVLSEAEGAEIQDGDEVSEPLTPISKEERQQIAKKILGAQKKVGHVSYLYQDKYNDEVMGFQVLQCAAAVFTVGAAAPVIGVKDYNVKAAYVNPYTVGFYNTANHEFAADFPVTGHKVHLDGPNINQSDYQALEAQGIAEAADVKKILPLIAKATQEDNPDQQKKLWTQVLGQMEAWNNKNQDKGTVYHRAQLLFNTLIGEVGQTTFQKTIEGQVFPPEFSEKLSQFLESQPKEEKDQLHKDTNHQSDYFRGGASDMNWDSTKCARFMNGDFNYISPDSLEIGKEDQKTSEGESKTKTQEKTNG